MRGDFFKGTTKPQQQSYPECMEKCYAYNRYGEDCCSICPNIDSDSGGVTPEQQQAADKAVTHDTSKNEGEGSGKPMTINQGDSDR